MEIQREMKGQNNKYLTYSKCNIGSKCFCSAFLINKKISFQNTASPNVLKALAEFVFKNLHILQNCEHSKIMLSSCHKSGNGCKCHHLTPLIKPFIIKTSLQYSACQSCQLWIKKRDIIFQVCWC